MGRRRRPRDARTLQAVSAVGQARLVQTWGELLGAHGLVVGQVLLAPLDFMLRAQYLQARGTLERLLDLGVVPVVNENDAVADDELRFGDNDRIAALVAQLVGADLLVLLTDTPGLMDADPRVSDAASLIEEIVQIDHQVEALAGGAGTERGSGGMASKLAAAKMASWSGVRAVIAAASRPDVVRDAVDGVAGVGTAVVATGPPAPRTQALDRVRAARPGSGRDRRRGRRGRSSQVADRCSQPAWSRSVASFAAEDAVEICEPGGRVVAKGLSRVDAAALRTMAGRRSADMFDGEGAVVHRDDLVLLTD